MFRSDAWAGSCLLPSVITVRNTSAIANMPTIAGMKLTPPISST